MKKVIQAIATVAFIIWSAAFLPVWLASALMCGNGKPADGLKCLFAYVLVWVALSVLMMGVQEFKAKIRYAVTGVKHD